VLLLIYPDFPLAEVDLSRRMQRSGRHQRRYMAPERSERLARPFSFTGPMPIQRPFTLGGVARKKRCELPALQPHSMVSRRGGS
jgi:hypothetical protein